MTRLYLLHWIVSIFLVLDCCHADTLQKRAAAQGFEAKVGPEKCQNRLTELKEINEEEKSYAEAMLKKQLGDKTFNTNQFQQDPLEGTLMIEGSPTGPGALLDIQRSFRRFGKRWASLHLLLTGPERPTPIASIRIQTKVDLPVDLIRDSLRESMNNCVVIWLSPITTSVINKRKVS